MNLETLILPLATEDNAFRAGLSRAIQLVEGAIQQFDKAIKATFEWADQLDSLQDIMGVTNKTAAALNFTLRKSGTETDALARGMIILNKGVVDANGKLDTAGKSLQKWGINVFDANDVLKDQETLLGEVADKYASLGTQQEKVNFLTEVFGRSGAELIDFFDTLAADGGIDAVTKKVEALGLAIDPNRYEQFNRNIEELKLVGLSLAVAFTERVMPAIEGFVKTITDFAADPDPKKLLTSLDSFVGDIIQGLTNKINEWVYGDGPEELSDKIVSWVEDIGTGPGFDSKIAKAGGNLLKALLRVVNEIEWQQIGDAIDNRMAGEITKVDWEQAGDTLGDKIEELFSQKLSVDDLNPQSQLGDQWLIQLMAPGIYAWADFLRGTEVGQALGTALSDLWTGLVGEENLAAFDTLDDTVRTKLLNIGPTISTTLSSMNTKFYSSGFAWTTLLLQGISGNIPAMITTLSNMEINIDSKLREVAKTFFNRALAWTQQAKAGFSSGIGGLLAAIGGIVDDVNKVLRKIITSFTISIKLPSWLGGAATPTATGTPNPPGAVTVPTGAKAGGGPVIAGRTYEVGEHSRFFNSPEMFTPSVNGRIDQYQAPQMQMVHITNWSDLDYSRLANEIIKAENNS